MFGVLGPLPPMFRPREVRRGRLREGGSCVLGKPFGMFPMFSGGYFLSGTPNQTPHSFEGPVLTHAHTRTHTHTHTFFPMGLKRALFSFLCKPPFGIWLHVRLRLAFKLVLFFRDLPEAGTGWSNKSQPRLESCTRLVSQ